MKRAFLLLIFILFTYTSFAHKEKWDDNKEDWSPLMLAIYNNQTSKIEKLLKQNVDLNYISIGKHSNWELTALEVAIRKENDKIVEKLLSTKRVSKAETFLMTACGQQNVKTVELLLKYGANPNESLENNYSVSMMATSSGSIEILECLLKNGASVNQSRKTDGMTALMFATFCGDINKVKLLISYNADKYLRDKNGKTALEYVDKIYDRYKISESTKKELKEQLK